MVYNPLQYLPSALELPDSDDTPVDNELQILIPTLLRAILAWLWSERQDWFLGVNMGFYYEPKEPAIVPDGFLSLGVERRKSERGRLSYVLWEEKDIVPQFVLEVVSRTYGQEYEAKLFKLLHNKAEYCVSKLYSKNTHIEQMTADDNRRNEKAELQHNTGARSADRVAAGSAWCYQC